jgi:hypothetical protein
MKINEIISEGKTGPGLWANIHAKRKRGERMRKPGSKGAPTDQDFKDAASEGVAKTNVSKYKDLGATKDTTHFIKNVTTGEIVSPHRSKQDAEDALVAHYRGPRDGNEYKIVRARKEGVAEDILEETYNNDDEFFEAYGVMEYNDEMINEAEYQGHKVTLNKPMQGDVKKFKVYTKNEKGNVVKVNFGDPNSTIKKNNPARRRSFRARHNCDNPGPKTGARYWSCRKW